MLIYVATMSTLYCQAPQKVSFQSAIRNSSNALIINQQIAIKISVLQGSTNGLVVYSERHTPVTNINGLASVEIGSGSILSGNFLTIDWAEGTFFVKSEVDINGGTNYTISNTIQLLSVPYSLFSNDVFSKVSTTGDTLYIGKEHYIIPGISAANQLTELLPTDHSCGEPNVHNAEKNYGTLIDQQGNTYKTITIGGQTWMAENLKVSVYRNGDAIPNLTNPSQWGTTTSGAWLNYNNVNGFDCPYGKLYNWYTCIDSRNVCPNGWHVPSIDEWYTLQAFLGGENVSGAKMKSTGTDHWDTPNEAATNESGFSALPNGTASSSAESYFLGQDAYFWSATPVNNFVVAGFKLYSYSTTSNEIQNPRSEGMAIRCVQD